MGEHEPEEIELPDGTRIERRLSVEDLSEESKENVDRLIRHDAVVLSLSSLHRHRRAAQRLRHIIHERRIARDFGDEN